MSHSEKLKEKENIIIKAARERFAHYGFSKVTMDEIASDIAMGKASLYYYFPTKEELFRAVIEQEQSEFVEDIESVLKKNIPASEKILLYVEQRIQYLKDLFNLGMLSVHSFIKPNPMFKSLFIELEKEEQRLLQQIFEEGKKNKEFRNDISENTTLVFIHILQGLRFRTLKLLSKQTDNIKTYEELREEMIVAANIFIRGISN